MRYTSQHGSCFVVDAYICDHKICSLPWDITGVLLTSCLLHQTASQVVVAVEGVVDQQGADQLGCQADSAPVLPQEAKMMPQQEPSAHNIML